MHEKALKYLQVLELEAGANIRDVKNSYKLLTMAWHPDRFGNEKHKISAEEKQKNIIEAYRWLSENKEILQELFQGTTKRNTKKSKSKQASSKSDKPKYKYRKKPSDRSYKSQCNYIEIDGNKYNVNNIREVQAKEYSNHHFRTLALVIALVGAISPFYGIYLLFTVPSDVGIIPILTFPFLLIAGSMLLIKDKIDVFLVYNNGNSEKLRTHKLFSDKPSIAYTRKEKEKGKSSKKNIYSNIQSINNKIKHHQRE